MDKNARSMVDDMNLFSDILRKSGYKSTSYGAAEIIDNSLDARASSILIIFESEGSRIKNIGFIDNGIGMDEETLWKAITVGGRKDIAEKKGGSRGKYGFGLPGACSAHSENFEIYSWNKETDGSIYKVECRLNKLNEGIAKPIKTKLPKPYDAFWDTKAVICTDGKVTFGPVDFKKSGTLVLWKGCERVKPINTNILIERYLIGDLSRIFRHFITNDKYSRARWNNCNITLCKNLDDGRSAKVYNLKPNDPLFLMKDHFVSKELGYFEEKTQLNGNFILNNTKVEIRFSLAPKKVRQKFSGPSKINELIGKNSGISIVREGREIDMDEFGYYDSSEDRNRWWGCEILFNKAADDYFGVPANKQHIDALKEFCESDDDGSTFPEDAKPEDLPMWLALEREFNIKSILKEFLKTIRNYSAGSSKPEPGNDTSDDDYPDLIDDPGEDDGSEVDGTLSEDQKKARELAISELKKIDINNPSEEQIKRFLNHKVVLLYVPLGETLGFIDISIKYGICILKINKDSYFYKKVLEEISVSDIKNKFDIKRGLEITLLAYARSLYLHRNHESHREFVSVLKKWSSKVEDLLGKYYEES